MVKINLQISDAEMRALIDVYNLKHEDKICLDEERLKALYDTSINLDELVINDSEESEIEYDKFKILITATVIDYFCLAIHQQ